MLMEQVVQVLDHKEKKSEIDETHCDFMSGFGSTNAVFCSQVVALYAANKLFYMPSFDLKKTLDWIGSGRQCEN